MERTYRLTFGRRAVSCRVKLLKFGLKFLVDEQKGFHCANHVAATGGYNLIDNKRVTLSLTEKLKGQVCKFLRA
jgi:hypothetical protein